MVDPVRYFEDALNMKRCSIEIMCRPVVSALFVVGVLVNSSHAQVPPPTPTPPSVQSQVGQSSEGVSGQANVGPTSVPAPGVSSVTGSRAGKKFSSAGQGLPGMPGGPPIKGSTGSQDPSSRYMVPPVIPPLFCDPAVNTPC